jgi:biotin-dependent carboxylase-like uncharacterized protein
MDRYSHRLANRLVGNLDEAATLEVTLIGPHLLFESQTAFSVAGAEFLLTLNDTPIETNSRIDAPEGSVLKFGERRRGARSYIAVAGGIAVPEVLRSRSTHLLTSMGGFAGRGLRAGDRLETGDRHLTPKSGKGGSSPLCLPDGGARLRAIPCDQPLFARVSSQRFIVSPRSDRMGYRLEGVAIPDASGELISAPVAMGAIQVPPTGQPILLMADRATTGGYAVAGVVITADLPVAGQLAPGDWIEFESCSLETADEALRRQERALGS